MSENLTNKTLRGIRSQTAIVVIKGGLSLINFAIMSRLLSPDDFGYFALLTAVTTILNSLSEAGLGSSIIQKKDITRDFASTAFSLSLCFGAFFSAILFLFARQFSILVSDGEELSLAFKLMSSTIFIQAANNITWALYMRKFDFFKFGILQICADTVSYFVGITFAIKGFGFYSIVAAGIASQLSLTIILIILKKYQFRLIIVKGYVKEILNYGGWLTATVIVRNLTNEIDKIIIGKMMPIADLGAINRPQGFISRLSSQVNGIFDTVLFPVLSSIQDDRNRISSAYIKIVTLVVTFSFIFGAIVSLGSKILIDIFFGSQWEHLQPLLIIFALALMVHGYSRIADSFFRSLGIVKRYFIARLINWGVFITAVWTGCHFGLVAVAVCMCIGSMISCVIKYYMQKNAVGVTTAKLLKSIFRNVVFVALIFIVSIIIMYKAPYGEYIGLITFLVFFSSAILFYPKVFGCEFNDTIIDRYFKRNKN